MSGYSTGLCLYIQTAKYSMIYWIDSHLCAANTQKLIEILFWPFSDLSVNHLKRAAKTTVCLSLFSDFLSKKQKQHLKTSKKSENSQVKIHNNQKTPLNYHSGSFLNYVTLIWLKFNTPASSIMPKLQFFAICMTLYCNYTTPPSSCCITYYMNSPFPIDTKFSQYLVIFPF